MYTIAEITMKGRISMLVVNGLTKRYDQVLAVDNISFEVKGGEIGVLLGPNGAGKSTTIISIAGLLKFDGTILINPKMVLFDEPMMGLDPKAIKELKDTFLELREKGCSVLISTHILDSIEGVWDRVLVMNKGKIVLSRTRKELENGSESLEKIFFAVTEGAV